MRTELRYACLASRALAVFVMLLAAALAHAAPPDHRLTVVIGADRVHVTRATPGGDVLLVGFELTSEADTPVHRCLRHEQAAGADGSLDLALGRPTVAGSYWVAFDLESGAYGGGAHVAMKRLREAQLPDRALRRSANGALEIEVSLESVVAIAIRPGVGSWELTTGDGGDGDADGSLDGKILLAPGRLTKRGKTSKDLSEFRDGDWIAVFSPERMGYLIRQVGK